MKLYTHRCAHSHTHIHTKTHTHQMVIMWLNKHFYSQGAMKGNFQYVLTENTITFFRSVLSKTSLWLKDAFGAEFLLSSVSAHWYTFIHSLLTNINNNKYCQENEAKQATFYRKQQIGTALRCLAGKVPQFGSLASIERSNTAGPLVKLLSSSLTEQLCHKQSEEKLRKTPHFNLSIIQREGDTHTQSGGRYQHSRKYQLVVLGISIYSEMIILTFKIYISSKVTEVQ